MPAPLDQEIRLLRTSFWSARDPDGRAFAPLAEALRRERSLDEAESLLTEGLARHPTFTTALLVAARVARDRGDLAVARERLDRLLRLDAGNVLALRDRAEARLVEGDREGAVRDLSEAYRLDPANDDVRRRIEAAQAGQPIAAPIDAAPPTEPAPPFDAPTPPDAPHIAPHGDEPEHEHEHEFVDRPILTRTMGDIYARQGFIDRALEVYEHLHKENPDDEEVRARLDELRGGGEAASAGRDAGDESERDAESEPVPQGRAPGAPTRTIAGYFEDLLAWVPGAVPIASLAPDADGGEEQPRQDGDEFNRWLEGLGR